MKWSRASVFSDVMTSPNWSRCEHVIKSFEDSWRLGEKPAIEAYLSGDDEVRLPLLIELVHVDLEFRMKSGTGVRVEEYIQAFPELAGDQHVMLDLIEAEHDLRSRYEGGVEADEYAERFPALQETLVRRFSSADLATRVSAAAARPGPAPWPLVSGFEILGQIGQGGMGIVYKAHDPHLDRLVALKFLPAEFADNPDRLDRFLREARTASALNHPHICTIHALDEHDGRPFIVMEFVEGRTLTFPTERRPDLTSVLRWIRQAAQALAAAHAAGVVHRDIKPENIMVRNDGIVKVLDFGLARRLPTLLARDAGNVPETDPGTLLGTVAYMSPEQTQGSPAETASDIFSLGVVAYQLLTARHPFQGETPFAMLHAIAASAALAPARLNPEIPAAISGLIEAMLRKEPELRPTAAEVESSLESLQLPAAARAAEAKFRPIVRRERELQTLRGVFAEADAGRGSFVCIAGEPGIGKTTLVEDFLAGLQEQSASCLVARGNCSERLADTEAYLPVLDALESLLRRDANGSVARILNVFAPTWYAQVAPAARDAAAATPNSFSQATSQKAMLREFLAFLQEATQLCAVVLFFDDVHWADLSTVDLLAHLGRHCHDLRVLIVATLRPTELLLGPHPFHSVKLELQSRGACTEVPLSFLGRRDIEHYLTLAFGDHAFPQDFADLIHTRTEGNPLFMTDLVRDLCEREVLAKTKGRWQVIGEVPDLSRDLPQSVRGMIQRKLDRLDQRDRQLLSAASVQGSEFSSLVLADMLGWDAANVDERLVELDRVHGLVRSERPEVLPDRSLSMHYSFVHILYQQALYHNLLATQRAALSLKTARALEKRHRKTHATIAADLACLYEVGRDFLAAAHHFWLASQNAARVFAHGEAATLARRGIQLLQSLSLSPERSDLEFQLHTMLGLQLQVTEGYGASSAKAAYESAREMCLHVPGNPPMFPVIWGLWLHHKVRSELTTAQDFAMELFRLARESNDPDLALQAHQALAMTAFCRGHLETALQHVEQAAALYDRQRHATHSFQFGQDPGVICKAFGAIVLWLLGFPDAAARQSEQAIAMSLDLSPSSQAVAYFFAAIVHQLRRDVIETKRCADRCGEVSAEHGFSFWLIGSNLLRGWSLATQDEADEGIAVMRQALIDWESIGSITYRTYFLGILSERLMSCGRKDEAYRLLTESICLARETDEGFYEPELYRLMGECILAHREAELPSKIGEARGQLVQAVELARRRVAKSLQLRAAISLCRFDERFPGEGTNSRQHLEDVVRECNDKGQTPDLQEAQAILEAPIGPKPKRR